MSGYIGKIAAIVTANTSDFTSKLAGTKKELNAFGASIRSTITSASNSAGKSFDAIFTPLQRLQRALEAATKSPLNLRTEDQVRKLQALVSVTEDINKPLASAAKSFTGLSRAVAAEFQPALVRAQGQVQFIEKQFEIFGRISEATFNRVARNVEKTTIAIRQLSEATSLLRSLPTGRELAFSDPRLAANLQAAQRAGRQALSLPANEIIGDPQIAGLTSQINRVSELAIAAAARVKAAVTPGDTAAAQKEYDRLNLVLETLVARLNKKYTLVVDTQRAQADAAKLRQELDFALTARPQNLEQVASVYGRLRAEVEQLAVAQRAAFGGNLGKLTGIIASGDVSRLAEAKKLIDLIEADLASQKKLNIDTSTAEAKIKSVREKIAGVAAGLSSSPQDPFELLKRSAEQAKQAVDRVSDATRRQQLQQRLSSAQALIAADGQNAGVSEAQLRRLAIRRAALLDGITQAASARSSGDIFGSALNSSTQRIDSLQSKIASLQSGIAALPAPLQTKLIPALNRARDAFAALGTAPAAAELAKAARQAENLEKQLKRAQAAAQFRGTFRGFLNDSSIDRYKAQLDSVQRQLASVGATAGGPVASAVNTYRRALAEAARAGTLGTQQTRREMEQYIQAIARAAVQTKLLTQAQAQAFARNVGTAGVRQGDIGRGGVDRFTLALNQLAFAVDDFFSVTGGLEQRVRAAGNNITQLGVIAGGTAGLFIGLFTILSAQGFLAFQRFINKGVEAKDRLKQLGEAARQQEQIVKDLADAFRELSDDLAQRGLTEATKRAEQLSKRLDDIIKKQQQLQKQRLADVDPEVQEARGQQAVLRRRLEEADTPGQRIALQALLDEQRRREEAAVAAVLGNAQGVDVGASIRQITGLIFREQLAAITDAGGVQSQRGVPFAQRVPESAQFRIDTARDRAALAFDGVDPANREAVRAALIEQRDRLTSAAAQRTVLGFRTNEAAAAEEALVAVERLLRSLDATGRQADLDRFAQGVAKAANSVDSFLPKAIERLQEASETVRQPSLQLLAQIEALTNGLRKQVEAVAAANVAGDTGAAREAEAQANRIAEQIKAREGEIAAIESTVNSVKQFAATLDRISTQLANTVASEARSSADQARREANATQAAVDRAVGPRGVPPAVQEDANVARRRRERTEKNAREAEDRAAENEARNAELREDFERDARGGDLGQETQRLIEERDAIDAIIRGDIAASEEQQNQARRRRDEIDRQLDRNFEDSPRGREARDRADQADQAQAGRDQREEDIRRGRELSQSPAEQAGRQLADDLRALQAQRDEALLAAGDKAALDRDLANDRRRIIEDSRRQQAPAIFALGDAVQNAVLQGPSRAALQATDVSTVEGASELNRLLRGDDAARDQDLAELQKQSAALEELVRIAREGGAVIAN